LPLHLCAELCRRLPPLLQRRVPRSVDAVTTTTKREREQRKERLRRSHKLLNSKVAAQTENCAACMHGRQNGSNRVCAFCLCSNFRFVVAHVAIIKVPSSEHFFQCLQLLLLLLPSSTKRANCVLDPAGEGLAAGAAAARRQRRRRLSRRARSVGRCSQPREDQNKDSTDGREDPNSNPRLTNFTHPIFTSRVYTLPKSTGEANRKGFKNNSRKVA
jgi:hypothetical protein